MIKDNHSELRSPKAAEYIIKGLDNMIKYPQTIEGVRSQQVALAMSANQIKECLLTILEEEAFLVERLKHAESERFN